MGDNIDNGLKWLQDVGILGGYTNMNEKITRSYCENFFRK